MKHSFVTVALRAVCLIMLTLYFFIPSTMRVPAVLGCASLWLFNIADFFDLLSKRLDSKINMAQTNKAAEQEEKEK